MKLAALALLFAGAVGCTPLSTIDRFDGDFGAAKEKRRVLALASPT